MASYADDAATNRFLVSGASDFFAQQAKLLGASALLLRDEQQRLLLVKPHYRPAWLLPGGLMEAGESPQQTAAREVHEEIALSVPVGRLLAVDYKSATVRRPACMQFVFDGGILSAEQLGSITVQAEEIAAWQLAPRGEAVGLLESGGPANRLRHTLMALDTGITAYLEDGQPPS
jgi:8-oxo-dGTP diphosphatase